MSSKIYTLTKKDLIACGGLHLLYEHINRPFKIHVAPLFVIVRENNGK